MKKENVFARRIKKRLWQPKVEAKEPKHHQQRERELHQQKEHQLQLRKMQMPLKLSILRPKTM
jgi:hypothetical protein